MLRDSRRERRAERESVEAWKTTRSAKTERMRGIGGEGGIRTHVPLTRQDAFEAPPLRPLRYLSAKVDRVEQTHQYSVTERLEASAALRLPTRARRLRSFQHPPNVVELQHVASYFEPVRLRHEAWFRFLLRMRDARSRRREWKTATLCHAHHSIRRVLHATTGRNARGQDRTEP